MAAISGVSKVRMRIASFWQAVWARVIRLGTPISAHRSGPANPRSTRAIACPWYNAYGEMIARDLAHLHGDTLQLARLGNNITKLTNLTEKGQIVYGLGDFPDPQDGTIEYVSKTIYSNRHEVVTGSKPDGRAYTGTTVDYTCNNYTSNAAGTSGQVVRRNGIGAAMQVGMSDRNGGGNGSWNSAHSTGGCSQADVVRTHGQGKFYCFAIS